MVTQITLVLNATNFIEMRTYLTKKIGHEYSFSKHQ